MTNLLKNDMVENNIPYRIFKGRHVKNTCFLRELCRNAAERLAAAVKFWPEKNEIIFQQ